MTISSQVRTAGPYAGNGSVATFPFAFKIFTGADLVVARTNPDGSQTALVLSSDFTASLNADQDANPGGTITLLSGALPDGYALNLTSSLAVLQLTALTNQGGFFPKVIERALDRLTIIIQQLGFVNIKQALRVPDVQGVAELPPAGLRANKVLSFDPSGNPVAISPTSGSVIDFAITLLTGYGSSIVGFLRSIVYPTGTVGRVLSGVSVGVQELRQVADADDYLSFQRAINSLPAAGGTIKVPDAAYVLNTEPNWGTKSIYWDIGPGATFSGAGTGEGKFPYMNTNTAQMAVGPFIQSQSSIDSVNPNGGIAALSVEMLIPPDGGPGQSVAIYAGTRGTSTDPGANGWAINGLIAVDVGAKGTYQVVEFDVDTNSTDALVKGIALSGGGAANPDVAIEITRLSGLWDRGLHIFNASDAIVIDTSVGRGIVIGAVAPMVDSAISIQQLANGAETLFLQRAVNTSPFGYYLRAVNADNTANVLQIDVQGNLGTVGLVTGANMRATQGALPGGTNTLSLGSLIFPTATAGAGAAVPANVFGFLEIYQGSTRLGLPLFPLS